jgi:hypothetical protein
VSRQVVYRVQDDPAKAEAMLAEWGDVGDVRRSMLTAERGYKDLGSLADRGDDSGGDRKGDSQAALERPGYHP